METEMDLFAREDFVRSVLDAFPAPVLVVDRDLRIYDLNRSAREWIGGEDVKLKRLCGDTLHCLYARDSKAHCGATEFCPDCVLRQTVEAVAEGARVFR